MLSILSIIIFVLLLISCSKKRELKDHNKIVFVSSFNEKLFNESGKKMLSSFVKNVLHPNIHLILVIEDYARLRPLLPRADWLTVLDLESYDYFTEWKAPTKNVGGYFNKNARHFFCKVASLSLAKDFCNNPNKIIWLDCDLEFVKHLSYTQLIRWFSDENVQCYYLMGPYRRRHGFGIESSFLVFNPNFSVLSDWIREFVRHDFAERHIRYDDGWVLKDILQDYPAFTIRDIGKDSTNDRPMLSSILGDYVIHHKGRHQSIQYHH